MKAGKQEKQQNEVELVGKVVSKIVDKGSKNEHDAVCLETDQGSYVLRRMGVSGMAFGDPVLQFQWVAMQHLEHILPGDANCKPHAVKIPFDRCDLLPRPGVTKAAA